MACEVNMITQYLKQILGYRVEFKVCLVSKLLVVEMFSNFCKIRDKCVILQILLKKE